MAKIIDGRLIAREILARLRLDISKLGFTPRLNILQVDNAWQSDTYIRLKQRVAQSVGIQVNVLRLPETTDEEEILRTINRWNTDVDVHAIVLQTPLPEGIDSYRLFNAISTVKDVDGLCDANLSLIDNYPQNHDEPTISATALAVLRCLEYTGDLNYPEMVASVIGQGRVSGVPIYRLLRVIGMGTVNEVTTSSGFDILKQSDVIVSAAGSPKIVQRKHCRPGCIVIDVGFSRTDGGQMIGDVDFDDVSEIAQWITPVPGGVGPVTVAMLLRNTYLTALRWKKTLI
ncbi:hypothetical protein ACOME3_007924 [Neoechinorhynchus agilis]